MTLTLATIIILTLASHAGAASHYPTSRAALAWRPSPPWLKQAACIHRHESAGLGWHLAFRDWRGRPSSYSGGMQFLDSTWHRAGGAGSAFQWSPLEQQYRAWVIWRKNGGSWREWGTAGMCGLR